jgi:hypothetical protein
MNLKVFLEWFHRLDAFVVGIALLVQLGAAWFWRKELPRWLLPLSFLLVLLVVLQGGLGALTVLQLLPSAVVTAHLVLALTLVIAMSGLTQRLLHSGSKESAAPRWWPFAWRNQPCSRLRPMPCSEGEWRPHGQPNVACRKVSPANGFIGIAVQQPQQPSASCCSLQQL